jgi:hypothetical protein
MHLRKQLASVVAAGLCSFFAAASALAQAIPGKELHLTNTRNMPFCEVEVATGAPPEIRVNFNNTSGASDCPPDKFDAINPQQLAQQLRADRVVLNPRRHWMMDQFTISGIGETKDFDGVKATWMGSMALKDFMAAAGGEPFTPFETNRSPSRYVYEKGKPVFLLVPRTERPSSSCSLTPTTSIRASRSTSCRSSAPCSSCRWGGPSR